MDVIYRYLDCGDLPYHLRILIFLTTFFICHDLFPKLCDFLFDAFYVCVQPIVVESLLTSRNGDFQSFTQVLETAHLLLHMGCGSG
ncbi:MAG: hypothetical protein CMM60_11090 [Rhodospirillaceae bacterium]|nr:hypothetical protein [Rhodospirillaceae bacterium]